MVVVDANVLLYAVDSESAHHEQARSWLDRVLAGGEAVGLAWVALLAFARIASNPAIMQSAVAGETAMEQVEAWLAAPAAVVLHATARHAVVLRGLLRQSGAAGNLVNDAHLAALAIENDAAIVSYDRGFARFAGVRHQLPR